MEPNCFAGARAKKWAPQRCRKFRLTATVCQRQGAKQEEATKRQRKGANGAILGPFEGNPINSFASIGRSLNRGRLFAFAPATVHCKRGKRDAKEARKRQKKGKKEAPLLAMLHFRRAVCVFVGHLRGKQTVSSWRLAGWKLQADFGRGRK